MEKYIFKNKVTQKSVEGIFDTVNNRFYQIIDHYFKNMSILTGFEYCNIPFFKRKASLESVHLSYSHLT